MVRSKTDKTIGFLAGRWAGSFFLMIGLVGAAACTSKPVSEPAAWAGAAIAPAEQPAPPDLRAVIVALGDSLTAGYGVEPRWNYPARLQSKIDSEGYSYRVVNAGVSGDTSAQGLARLDAIRSLRPAIVIVELGANDGLRGIPAIETRKNLEEIVTRLDASGAKVVLAGMELPPNYGPEYTRQFHDLFPALANAHRTGLVPFFLQGVGGIPGLNQDDGIHPTAEGYGVVTENVWKVLQPLLRK